MIKKLAPARLLIAMPSVVASFALVAFGIRSAELSDATLSAESIKRTTDKAAESYLHTGSVWSGRIVDFKAAQPSLAKTPAPSPTPAASSPASSQPLPAVDDGSAKAPAGVPQRPELLKAYKVRPPWNVAGVDYHVGVPAGTVLKPISQISMPGVEVDNVNRLIRISGQNVIVDGYDFSGWSFYIQGQNITIQNCYSRLGTGYWIVGRDDGGRWTSSNITIRNCEIDGTGLKFASMNSFINIKGTGTHTIEYNYLHSSPTHILEWAQANEGPATLIYRYNLEEDIGIDPTGQGPTNHVNFTQMLGGRDASSTSVNSRITFNTMIQHPQPAGGEMIQVSGSNALVANNTMIALPRAGRAASISYMVDPGHAGTYFQGTVRDNYVDASGAYGFFYPTTGNSLVILSASGNIDMKTGQVIQTNNAKRTPERGN